MRTSRAAAALLTRLAKLRDERGGVTLAELFAVMGISLLIGAAGLTAIQASRTSASKTVARQEGVSQAEFALARMTQETRQATYVRATPTRLDMKTRVRPSSGGASALQHVRYDCGSGACTRTDCGAAPSGSLATAACTPSPETIIRGVDHGSFAAQLGATTVDLTTPRETPAFDFVNFRLVVSLSDFSSGRQAARETAPIELTAGVDLANV